jgi:hypothetical protein
LRSKTLIAVAYLGYLLWLSSQGPAASPSVPVDPVYAQAAHTLPLLRHELDNQRKRSGVYPATDGDWVVLSRSVGPEAGEQFVHLEDATRIDIHWKAPPLAFLYRSDGTDYKLVVHSPDLRLCLKARDMNPAEVDPARTYYAFGVMPPPNWPVTDPPQQRLAASIIRREKNWHMRDDPALNPHIRATCSAFGYWTAGAEAW